MSAQNTHSRRTLLKLLFWGAALFAFAMAVDPHPPAVPGNPSDKIQHMVAFAVLGVLAALAYSRQPLWRLLLALSAFGAVIEFAQLIPILHRDSDPLDWVADTIACGLVLFCTWAWRRHRR